MRTTEAHPNPTSILLFYRSYSGLTQTEVAKDIGLSTQDISRFERGSRTMTLGKVIRIAQFIGIHIHDLITNNYTALLPQLTPRPVIDPQIQTHRRNCQLKKLDVGNAGESFVAARERALLKGTPFENGVNENYANDPNNGFDAFSFKVTGEPKIIEVKSTVGECDEPFYLSANELSVAKSCLEKGICYELHRVFRLVSETEAEEVVYSAHELLCEFDPEISQYLMKRRVAS